MNSLSQLLFLWYWFSHAKHIGGGQCNNKKTELTYANCMYCQANIQRWPTFGRGKNKYNCLSDRLLLVYFVGYQDISSCGSGVSHSMGTSTYYTGYAAYATWNDIHNISFLDGGKW